MKNERVRRCMYAPLGVSLSWDPEMGLGQGSLQVGSWLEWEFGDGSCAPGPKLPLQPTDCGAKPPYRNLVLTKLSLSSLFPFIRARRASCVAIDRSVNRRISTLYRA